LGTDAALQLRTAPRRFTRQIFRELRYRLIPVLRPLDSVSSA
jgi:hypothetical protein